MPRAVSKSPARKVVAPVIKKAKLPAAITAAALAAPVKQTPPKAKKPAAKKPAAHTKKAVAARAAAAKAAAIDVEVEAAPAKPRWLPFASPVDAPISGKKLARCYDATQLGDGAPGTPFRQPHDRKDPNASGCAHCPTTHCCCEAFDAILSEAIDECDTKRRTDTVGKINLCAKSILPNFVTRLVAILGITAKDTFYDFGSGNGSVLFQVAFMTGAKCVGVELCEHNAALSRQLWSAMRPRLELAAGRAMPEVEIIAGDLCDVIRPDSFATSPNTVIWTANLLMPRSVTHFMSERFRTVAPGTRILCFDDIWHHARALHRIRDPEAFELFDMTDYEWPLYSVEWAVNTGEFYRHVKNGTVKKQQD
jgi:hypothetical protein